MWIADNETDLFSEAITDVFESIFMKKVDSVGDSIGSPDGCNVKRYGVYEGNYGIYKTDYILCLPMLRVKLLCVN